MVLLMMTVMMLLSDLPGCPADVACLCLMPAMHLVLDPASAAAAAVTAVVVLKAVLRMPPVRLPLCLLLWVLLLLL